MTVKLQLPKMRKNICKIVEERFQKHIESPEVSIGGKLENCTLTFDTFAFFLAHDFAAMQDDKTRRSIGRAGLRLVFVMRIRFIILALAPNFDVLKILLVFGQNHIRILNYLTVAGVRAG